MKNRLLPLFVVLGSFSAYSQVGIGTRIPDPSAQLEIKAEDGLGKGRGLLIPRFELKSDTDLSLFVDGKAAESLLVYNLKDTETLKAGYCYWSGGRWNRIATAGEGSATMAGIAGGDGKPGDTGVVIPDNTTVWIDATTGTVYVYDAITKEWNAVSGKDGKNGVDGAPGLAGGFGAPGAG